MGFEVNFGFRLLWGIFFILLTILSVDDSDRAHQVFSRLSMASTLLRIAPIERSIFTGSLPRTLHLSQIQKNMCKLIYEGRSVCFEAYVIESKLQVTDTGNFVQIIPSVSLILKCH